MLKQRIHELLRYEPETGNFFWKVTKSPTAVAGQRAGSINAHGHMNLQIDKKMYAAHQLVFLIHHGYIPKEIDHINRVKTDNRIENLRECTSTQNKGNLSRPSSNSTGVRGVSLNRRSGKYHAQIKIMGKQTYLGRFDTVEEASVAYEGAARLYFGEFYANYSE
jgi:hypothetical protein